MHQDFELDDPGREHSRLEVVYPTVSDHREVLWVSKPSENR